jgi:hypothetical protein
MPTAHSAMLGSWKGTLEYRDYKDDKRVTLPTEMVVKADAAEGIEFRYAFDDGPGKTVRWTSIVALDPAAKRYVTQTFADGKPDGKRTEYRITSGAEAWQQAGKGTLEMIGEGSENGQSVDVRQVLTCDGQTYTLLRETRPTATPDAAFLFRHIYRMAKVSHAGN